MPIFSYGACPSGPQRLDPADPTALRLARFGEAEVEASDVVFADDDGCLFVAAAHVVELLLIADEIWQRLDKERALAPSTVKVRPLPGEANDRSALYVSRTLAEDKWRDRGISDFSHRQFL